MCLILSCLLVIAVLAVCYFASEIVLPIVLAFVLSLLFQPAMRIFSEISIPRRAGRSHTHCRGICARSSPLALLSQRLRQLGRRSCRAASHESRSGSTSSASRSALFSHFSNSSTAAAQPGRQLELGPLIEAALLKGTQHFASGFFETLSILFFLLISGDTFLRRLVEIVPTFKDKRRVVALSQQIEDNISAYLVTVTLMNAAVGAATA